MAAVDDDFALDPIGHLKKGLNLNYVYGDYNWKLLRSDEPYQNYPYYHAGDFIYPLARLQDCYSAQDFLDIKELGFDHVRITIDPWALGLLEHPGGTGDPMYSVPSSAQDVCDALRADVLAARAANLIVILDFHASCVAQGGWNAYYNSRRSELWVPNSNPPEHPPVVAADEVPPAPFNYLGTMKWHFLTTTTNGAGQYPLEEFWISFLPKLGSFSFPIVIELLNEPFDSTYEVTPDDITPVIWSLYGGPNVLNTESSVTNWVDSNRQNWRTITKKCLQSLEAEGRYFIVSPSTTAPGNYQENWAMIKPFTAETADGIAHPERLLYTVHFYTPTDFTSKNQRGINNQYLKERDYDPNSGSPYRDAPMSSHFAHVSQWIERSKAEWANAGIDQPLNMIFTEFGCVRSDRTRWPGTSPSDQPQLRGPGGPEEAPDPPDTTYGYPSSLTLTSSRWVYDARKEIQSYPAGWT